MKGMFKILDVTMIHKINKLWLCVISLYNDNELF